eukprot:SAG11_NODE_386_length_9887_cov_3.904986_3_plen_64_part_00
MQIIIKELAEGLVMLANVLGHSVAEALLRLAKIPLLLGLLWHAIVVVLDLILTAANSLSVARK